MSWTAFDGRTGNLYAIHEGTGPEEDVVSRWTMTSDLSNITREQESIGEQEGNGPIQPADIGWPAGNRKKLSKSQACCLAQLCLAAA